MIKSPYLVRWNAVVQSTAVRVFSILDLAAFLAFPLGDCAQPG